MIFIVLILLLFATTGALIYKPSKKAVLISVVILVLFFGWFLINLNIEDWYGKHNHVYADGKKGDKVILLDAQTSKEIATAEIENKTWERVFVKTESDTLELNDWIEKKGGYMADVKCEIVPNKKN